MSDLEATADFARSMPAAYREVFGASEVAEHARIVAERGDRSVHVVLWRLLPDGLAILCVVANDRPGLVLLVSAAFVANGLDVQSAQMYSRLHPGGWSEAVDFFWVRSSSGTTLADHKYFTACARTISNFVSGYAEPQPVGADADLTEAPFEGRVIITTHDGHANHWLISIEARDSSHLLLKIARTLHRHALEIIESKLSTEAGIARDRFVVASASAVDLDSVRLERVRNALLSAIVS